MSAKAQMCIFEVKLISDKNWIGLRGHLNKGVTVRV